MSTETPLNHGYRYLWFKYNESLMLFGTALGIGILMGVLYFNFPGMDDKSQAHRDEVNGMLAIFSTLPCAFILASFVCGIRQFISTWYEQPLYTAIRINSHDNVAYALSHGSDPNAKYDNKTPLMYLFKLHKKNANRSMSDQETERIVDTLMKHGAKLEPDELFEQYCTSSINKTKVKQLIKISDINTQDDKGNTMLHYAAQRSNEKLAKLLIKNGANKAIKNNDGDTPLDLVGTNKFEKMFK